MFVELFPILSRNDLHSSKFLVLSPLLEEKLAIYVDIIKARLTKEDLEFTSNSLHSYLFDLRLEVFRAIDSRKGLHQVLSNEKTNSLDIAKEIHEVLDDIASEKEKASHIPFNQNLASLLKDYQSISDLVLVKAIQDPNTIIPIDISKMHMSYEALRYIEALSSSFTYVRKMIDASLNFEFGLFVLDLLANNDIITKKDQIEQEINPFTKNALCEYGTYAILSNLWNLTSTQLDQPFFNKMKIKASIISSESGNTKTFSMNQLKQLTAS